MELGRPALTPIAGLHLDNCIVEAYVKGDRHTYAPREVC